MSVLPALEGLVQQVLMGTNRRSLASVRSGIKVWHEFSTSGLGYPPEASLPPRNSNHAVMFVAIFKNGATAQNYIGYVSFGCKILQLDITWRDGTVSLAIRGSRKIGLRLASGTLQKKYVLDDATMQRIIDLANQCGEQTWSDIFIFLYACMLRVQSEGTSIVVGQDSDALSMPDGVDASLWCSDKPRVARLRLRRRKHLHLCDFEVLRLPHCASLDGEAAARRIVVGHNGARDGEAIEVVLVIVAGPWWRTGYAEMLQSRQSVCASRCGL